jgi:hypothetical protein
MPDRHRGPLLLENLNGSYFFGRFIIQSVIMAMSYLILVAFLWLGFFLIIASILQKKYGSLEKAGFKRTFRFWGVICMFFVLLVMLAIKAFV